MSISISLVGKKGAGRFALIDEADLEHVSRYKWSLLVPNPACPHGAYTQAWVIDKEDVKYRTTLHRLIMEAITGQLVDHINGDGLDNRRCNLRLVTREQNQRNRRARNGSSYKGITQTPSGKWRARIEVEGLSRHLGQFETPLAASLAYYHACIDSFGSYAFGAAAHTLEASAEIGGQRG